MHIHRIHPIKLYCILLYRSLEGEVYLLKVSLLLAVGIATLFLYTQR